MSPNPHLKEYKFNHMIVNEIKIADDAEVRFLRHAMNILCEIPS